MKDPIPSPRKLRRPLRADRHGLARHGVVTDIPVRAGAGQALAPSGMSGPDYRELLWQCPVAILVRCDGKVAFANRAAHRLFRVAGDSVLTGMPWVRLLAPECGTAVGSPGLDQPAGDASEPLPQLDLSYQALDGARIRVESTGVRVDLAGRPAQLLVLRDVTARRDQARVLLVEDDPLSAEIVIELLRLVGIQPRLVNNGHEAVILLAEEGPAAYDLVLMDIEMPVLDGHAATRLIRSWSGFGALPIVALTAHAQDHEIQIGAAAGISDQISKPFDHAAFHAMLDKWLPRGREAARNAEAKARPAPPCIDVAVALSRFAGDEERYRQWLARFVEESPALAPELRRALASGALDQAAATVHAFKSTVGTLGLERLQARAAELEQAICGGGDAVPELRRFERAIDEARREIIARFGA